MAGVSLKRTGNTLLILCLSAMPLYAGGSVSASLEESTIGEGDSTVLTVTVPGGGRVSPGGLPDVPGLSIAFSGTQQSFSFINGRSSRSVSLNYTVTGERPGTYTIPPFGVTVNDRQVLTQPLVINVIKGSPERHAPSGGGAIVPDVAVSPAHVWEGQPVVMRYYILSDPGFPTGDWRMEENPASGGCVMNPLDEKIDDSTAASGGRQMIRRHLKSFVLTPASPGTVKAGGGTVLVEVEDRGFFSMGRAVRISFPVRTLEVMPLPSGKPADFSGNVGTFTMTESWDRTPVPAYGEKKITVTVKGRGNLLTMAPPALHAPQSVSVMADSRPPDIRPDSDGIEGERTFVLTVIPRQAGTVSLGRVEFTCFDPSARAYRTLRGADIVLDVRPGEPAGRDPESGVEKNEGIPRWLVVLLAAVIFCGGAAAVYLLFFREGPGRLPGGDNKRAAADPDVENGRAAAHDGEANLLSSEDTADFLRGAYLAVTRNISSGRGEPAVMAALRDELDLWRFGGGTPSRDDMERVRRVLGS